MKHILYLFPFLLYLGACQPAATDQSSAMPEPAAITPVFDWQGHRGARGLLPENTMPAFLLALEYPAIRTLELDVVISADSQVVVSHEPWLSPEICQTKDGQPLSADPAARLSLYQMPYASIATYDCGSLPHPRFPDQKKMAVPKPLLRDVVAGADARAKSLDRALPYYNIEIKSDPEWDGTFTPAPAEFVDLVVRLIRELGISDRCTVQSFDERALRELHQQAPDFTLAFLIENTRSFASNLESLGFTPAIYSPNHLIVSANLVKEVHEKKMQIIPWTVNETATMRGLINLGVDGIITDYPNRIPTK